MPKHRETRRLPYTPQQMFDLVADVERYPEFLPWVVGVRVRSDTPGEMVADVLVGFKALRERFSSRVTKRRPGSVHVDYLEGPLQFLRNEWNFAPDGQGGTVVGFSIDFAFRSRIFQAIAGQVFELALSRMIGAFETRAKVLYGSTGVGNSSSSAHSAA